MRCAPRARSSSAGAFSARRWSKDWASPAPISGSVSASIPESSASGFGRSHRDLTAIGTVVNTASRAQSAASAGQILVTQEVYHRAQSDLAGSQARPYQLKGFEAPVELYAA